MDLILWRHAEAAEAGDGEADLGRRLTGRGGKQARKMAEWLHARLPDSARILSSPALRCQQTARALAELAHRKLRIVDALAPGAGVDDVLAAVDWPHARQPMVVVGHQPTLGWVVRHLLADDGAAWSIRKGAVWWLQSRERADGPAVTLRAVINPDLL